MAYLAGVSYWGAPALPDEQDHRRGEQRSHGDIEETEGALGSQDALQDRAEGEPGQTAGQARKEE